MVLLDHRLTTLQAVRAAAALGVVGYHIAPTGEEGGQLLYQWLFARGHIGVDLFFVLSGFLMARRVLAPAFGERAALAFFLRRFFRVWPLYALLTTLFYFTFAHSSFVQYLRSLAFLPIAPDPPLVLGFPTLFVGWTLNYEFYFYLVCALSLILPHLKRLFVLCLWFLLTLLIIPILFQHSLGVAPLQTQPERYPVLYLALISNSILLEFLLGMGVYAILRQWGHALSPLAAKRVGWFAAVVFVVAYVVLDAKMEVIACGLPAALLVGGLALAETRGGVAAPAWAVVLGNASYAIYLVHPFWLNLIEPVRKAFPTEPVLWFGIMFVGTIASALVLYRFFETPINAWARGLARRIEARAA